MRLYQKNKRFPYLNLVLSFLVFAVIITAFILFVGDVSGRSNDESKWVTEQAIRKALVSCYAIEGIYPPSVDYLEKNYGVIIDHNRFEINYETIGTNIMPSVNLIDKNLNQ